MSTFMKRLTCLTLALTLLVTLGGCKKTAAETPPPESKTPEYVSYTQLRAPQTRHDRV